MSFSTVRLSGSPARPSSQAAELYMIIYSDNLTRILYEELMGIKKIIVRVLEGPILSAYPAMVSCTSGCAIFLQLTASALHNS
jgi:hypothetical protein